MGRSNHEGSNRFKKSEQYEGDTEREVEDKDEEGGQDHPAEYKTQAKNVAHAKDNNVKGKYLPYDQMPELYDEKEVGDRKAYLPKVGPSLSKIARSRRAE